MKIFRIPKIQMASVLFLLLLVSASFLGIPTVLRLLLLSVGFTILFDNVFTYIRRKRFFVPHAGIVTGLILALIIDPSATWYQIFAISAFAMGIKNFLRIGGRHIFNPAASGLLVGWLLFGLSPSWWAATLYSGDGSLFLNLTIYALLIAAFLVSCWRMKRYPAAVSYIFIYGILSLVVFSGSLAPVVKSLISPGVLFYTLVMLVEPMTSPVRRNRQVLYGALIAIVQTALVYISLNYASNIPDQSIVALLVGNLLFFKYK